MVRSNDLLFTNALSSLGDRWGGLDRSPDSCSLVSLKLRTEDVNKDGLGLGLGCS